MLEGGAQLNCGVGDADCRSVINEDHFRLAPSVDLSKRVPIEHHFTTRKT